MTKTDQLRTIKEEVVDGKDLPLYEERKKTGQLPVIGEGNHDAEIMFIGEAPGKNEAATGRPFVGAAGKFLTELIESIGLTREDVYITNVVKDRPPGNRDPLPDEIAAYSPFLKRQINIIQPKVIVALGRFSMNYLMETFGLQDKIEGISKIHGRTFQITTDSAEMKFMPMLHPASALYNPENRDVMKEDFKTLKGLLTNDQ